MLNKITCSAATAPLVRLFYVCELFIAKTAKPLWRSSLRCLRATTATSLPPWSIGAFPKL
jgi:hypothetical protein